ncbi:uncharacterized protein LOC120014113 [Tripterygium wilfordii]|uniref:uncharacterized protein LOC120014113 n=1 Tax=Tripterygium wilfordii TaxID=458696 RepID=UPI0018F817BF|nr:uncharacterized protein LOC120014113 [Tripterygium wilfordii]
MRSRLDEPTLPNCSTPIPTTLFVSVSVSPSPVHSWGSSGSYTYVDPDQQRYFFEEIFCLPSEQGSIVAVEKYSKESITTQTNMHGCSYGYLSDARRAIAKANPVIKAKKLYKIYNFFILAFKVVVRNTQKVE